MIFVGKGGITKYGTISVISGVVLYFLAAIFNGMDEAEIENPAPQENTYLKEIEDELIRQATIFYDKKAAEDPFAAEVLESMRAWKKAYGAERVTKWIDDMEKQKPLNEFNP